MKNYIENILIPEDNRLEDKTAQYLSAMPTEIAVTYTLKNKLQELFKEIYIHRFFEPCRTVRKCTWNSIFCQWNILHRNADMIEFTNCPHTKQIQNHLNNAIDDFKYDQFVFYQTYQDVVVPVSKRLGKRVLLVKIYCYCPMCKKLFCIGGRKHEQDQDIVNLIEYSILGKQVMKYVEKEVYHRIGRERYLGYCHKFWDKKKEILLKEFGIIWYSPRAFHPEMHYD
ncbi:hypothetical protein [Bacteroides acidifaciens]|uniref:hypothetical protein n=1 Tax=Bacteroides acidifaciens TaxID=85831 RepID=UPI002557D749|nr:hypothetical protein [Bacteroides acidifaciens]